MKKIFVVGCPRSGTTLVQKLLGGHSNIYTCQETHFFKKIRRKGKRQVLDHLILSQRNVLEAYDFIMTHTELQEQYDPDGIRTLRSATLFFDRMMTSEAQVRNKLAWVEKTPYHVFYIRLIKRYMPSAQFVHVIRDGRDVVASLVDAAERFPRVWKKYRDLEMAIDLYNHSLKESLKYCDSEDHIFVRYETILDDVEKICHELYASLGLESENLYLDFRKIHQRVTRSDEGWKNDNDGEIRNTKLVKFNQIFNDEQKRLISKKVETPPLSLNFIV